MEWRVFIAGGTEHSPFDHLDSLESRYIHWACLAKFHICILKGFWQRSNNGKATKVSIVNHVPLRIELDRNIKLKWKKKEIKQIYGFLLYILMNQSRTARMKRPQRPLYIFLYLWPKLRPWKRGNLFLRNFKKKKKKKKVSARVTSTRMDAWVSNVRPRSSQGHIRRGISRQKNTHAHVRAMHLSRAWAPKPLNQVYIL